MQMQTADTAAEESQVPMKKMLSAGPATAAGGAAARLPAPMQAGKGFLQCLTAIGQMGGDDSDSDAPAQLQQGVEATAKGAPAPAAGAAAGCRSPFESAQGFVNCVTAVGHLAADME